ncbi:MAG: Calx-beta domain-containing protein [Nonlabens sp.]
MKDFTHLCFSNAGIKKILLTFLFFLPLSIMAQEIAVLDDNNNNLFGGDPATTVNFGSVNVGSSVSKTFTIQNQGGSELTINTPITANGDFTVTSQPSSPVATGLGTTTFTIQFAPTAEGNRTGSIAIGNNDFDENPFGINFSGTGIAVNSAPDDIILSQSVLNESATGVNATVGTLFTNDADPGDTFTYSLVSGTGDSNNGSFNISGNTLRTNTTLGGGAYSVRINTNDGTDNFSKQFNILVVDDVAPVVTSVSVPFNDTYTVGENLDFTINFNENATVVNTGGTPQLSITVGSTARQAVYVSGSGTQNLLFRYTVQSGDEDGDGIDVNTLSLNGGTIQDAAGNNANLTLNSVGATTGVLVDAVPANISVDDPSLIEGNSGTGLLDFTISLDRAASSTTTVDYTTSDGTATAGTDYVAASGTLTFSTGESSKQVSITINGDTDIEADETITFTLSNVTGPASISDATGMATIENDDFVSGLQIDAADTNYTIDFDNTVSGINNGTYNGSGLDGIPTAGQLNSKGFQVTGLSDGNTTEGGTFTTGDYARGSSTGGEGGGGLYAFDVSNGGAIDVALGVQPGGSDFTPGSIILRMQNNTGAAVTTLDVAYEIHVNNDQPRSQSVNFEHGAMAGSTTGVSALDYLTEEAVFTPLSGTWKANYFQTQITGLNIPDGVVYFLKWSSNDGSGGGSRDEFAIDDIQVIANRNTSSPVAGSSYQDMKVNAALSLTQATDLEGRLDISGGLLETNDNLTFKSINYSGTIRTAILEEVQNGGTITSDVTVEQFYPANRAFRFVTSPVNMTGTIFENWQEGGSNMTGFGTHITGGNAADGFDQSPSNNPSLFAYDASGITGTVGWIAANTTLFPLNVAAGYRLMIRGDRTVSLTTPGAAATQTILRATGSLTTGDLTIDGVPFNGQTPFGADGSFYLMPNPYQAPVDLSQTLDATNSEDIRTDNYYAWQPVTENYVTYDFAAGGTQNGVTQFIQPGQAYFVQTSEASGTTAGYAPRVDYREDQKGSSTTATATYSQPEGSYAIRMYDSTLAGGAIANDLVRGFINTGYNNGIDNLDAVKIYGLREQLSLLSGSNELSIERRDHFTDQEMLPLRIYQMESGTYTFELEFNDMVDTAVELVDNYLGTAIAVPQNQTTSHIFNVDMVDPESFASDRFFLRFTTGTLSSGDTAFAKAVTLYPNPVRSENLNISGLDQGNVVIYVTNLMGQHIFTEKAISTNGTVKTQGFRELQPSIYLLTVSQQGKSTTRRVVVE